MRRFLQFDIYCNRTAGVQYGANIDSSIYRATVTFDGFYIENRCARLHVMSTTGTDTVDCEE